MSFIRQALVSLVMRRRLSEEGLAARRARAEKKRLRLKLPHQVDYFHQPDDPYSHLAAKALKPLLAAYDIELKVSLVGPPEDVFVPEREKLRDHSRKDAGLIAPRYGFAFADRGSNPPDQTVSKATAMLVRAVADGRVLDVIEDISEALWRGGALPDLPVAEEGAVRKHIADAMARRKQKGHYLGGVFCYGGESYWGLDRLHYLENRLRELGACKSGSGSDLLYPRPLALGSGSASDAPKEIDFFASLRSPYTAIVAKRVFELGKASGARVNIRYVLPMVMRGLPVPREKALYIADDTAREARSYGIPFGRISDPVGLPTERGLSVIPLAEAKGCAEQYLISFLEGVWAEGLNAGTDKGLRKITDRAGLDWTDVQAALQDDAWKKVAEANRDELFALGLWGVPSFHCGEAVLWGQDRLWALEEAI